MVGIVWFRQDLRVSDNPALTQAASAGPVLPVYILDQSTGQQRAIGGAARWWLHHSLAALSKSLGGLVLLRGDPRTVLADLAAQTGAQRVLWNRCYEPAAIARDTEIKADLVRRGIDVQTHNASLLNEPWTIATGAGGPFKVYSPYWRACLREPVERPLPAPKLKRVKFAGASLPLAQLGLLPTRPDWAAGWDKLWTPGETGAQARLERFLDADLKGYGELRNRPDLPNVSRLSPHLHWGEISPRQIWAQTQMAADSGQGLRRDADKFLSEIGWREFA